MVNNFIKFFMALVFTTACYGSKEASPAHENIKISRKTDKNIYVAVDPILISIVYDEKVQAYYQVAFELEVSDINLIEEIGQKIYQFRDAIITDFYKRLPLVLRLKKKIESPLVIKRVQTIADTFFEGNKVRVLIVQERLFEVRV